MSNGTGSHQRLSSHPSGLEPNEADISPLALARRVAAYAWLKSHCKSLVEASLASVGPAIFCVVLVVFADTQVNQQ